MVRTRITSKHQTTIPRDVRRRLAIRAGDEVEWHVLRQFALLRPVVRMKDPVAFLTSQIRLTIDAVAAVKRARAEMF